MVITILQAQTAEIPANNEIIYKVMIDKLIDELRKMDPEELIETKEQNGRIIHRLQVYSTTCSEYYEDEDNSTNEVLFIE